MLGSPPLARWCPSRATRIFPLSTRTVRREGPPALDRSRRRWHLRRACRLAGRGTLSRLPRHCRLLSAAAQLGQRHCDLTPKTSCVVSSRVEGGLLTCLDPLHLLSGLAASSSTSPTSANSASTPMSGIWGAKRGSRPATPSGPGTPGSATGVARQQSVRTARRRDRFASALGGDSHGSVNVGQLRSLAWAGVPFEVRPIVWQLLLVSRMK